MLLHEIQLELKLLLPLPHLDALAAHSDWKSLILALQVLLVLHELLDAHVCHLLDLILLQVGVLAGVTRNVRVQAALNGRVVLIATVLCVVARVVVV